MTANGVMSGGNTVTAEDGAKRVGEPVVGGMSRKDAIKQTAKELDLPKNVVHDAALHI